MQVITHVEHMAATFSWHRVSFYCAKMVERPFKLKVKASRYIGIHGELWHLKVVEKKSPVTFQADGVSASELYLFYIGKQRGLFHRYVIY